MISPVKKPSIAFLIFLLYTIPIAWFFFFVYTNSLNIPCGDDYKAILAFLNSFVRSASLSDKLNLIFSQYHEYRIGLCRIVTVLMYYIYGSINFKVLCVISNLSLIGIVYLFYKSFSAAAVSSICCLFRRCSWCFTCSIGKLVFGAPLHCNRYGSPFSPCCAFTICSMHHGDIVLLLFLQLHVPLIPTGMGLSVLSSD